MTQMQVRGGRVETRLYPQPASLTETRAQIFLRNDLGEAFP
jgi:hypothetical protein